MEGVALWCNSLAAVLWNSMKAEITRTRLVEQPSTERPQSQIVSVILTHSPPQTLALTFFCVFPLHALFLYIISLISLECPHFFLSFFLSLALSFGSSAAANMTFTWTAFSFQPCLLLQWLIFPFSLPVQSLLFSASCALVSFFLPFPPPHAGTVSSEAPLFYVSLDNGSDTLTLALM